MTMEFRARRARRRHAAAVEWYRETDAAISGSLRAVSAYTVITYLWSA